MGIEEKTCDCGTRVYHVFYDGIKLYYQVKQDYGKDKYVPHTCLPKQYKEMIVKK